MENLQSQKNILDQFPALKEYLKHGSLIEAMQEKGFDGVDIQLMMSKYELDYIGIPVLLRLQKIEKCYTELNHTNYKR